jgi:hypothetical protein
MLLKQTNKTTGFTETARRVLNRVPEERFENRMSKQSRDVHSEKNHRRPRTKSAQIDLVPNSYGPPVVEKRHFQ